MSETRHFIAAETATPPFFVGIDLGGTNIKFGVVDDLGRPLSWLSIPTEVAAGPGRRRPADGHGRAGGHRQGRPTAPGRRPGGLRLRRPHGPPRRHHHQPG